MLVSLNVIKLLIKFVYFDQWHPIHLIQIIKRVLHLYDCNDILQKCFLVQINNLFPPWNIFDRSNVIYSSVQYFTQGTTKRQSKLLAKKFEKFLFSGARHGYFEPLTLGSWVVCSTTELQMLKYGSVSCVIFNKLSLIFFLI